MSKNYAVAAAVVGAFTTVGLSQLDYTDHISGTSPETISQAWANAKTNTALALLNTSLKDRADSRNIRIEVTSRDMGKLLTAKREVALASGCCDTYNGKAVTYKFVINDPAQETDEKLGLSSSARMANEAAEKARRDEEAPPKRMSNGCCQLNYSGS